MAENTTNQELQTKRETPLQQGTEPTHQGRLFVPASDIRETNDSIVLTADMPGVRPDGVDITLENHVLTVRGTYADDYRRAEEPAYAEYEAGHYQRSFSLTDEIDHDGIEAKINNGVLTLTLPKVRPSKKRIEVQAG